MANDERRALNPRMTQSIRGSLRPRATDPPGGGTARPSATDPPGGGTARPTATDPPGGGMPRLGPGIEEEEGKAEPVVFTERLKSGYSTARNEELKKLWKQRKELGERWKELGPGNLGGRVTCLVAKSGSDANALLAGAACGGVWTGKVTGTNSNLHCEWKPTPDNEPFLHNIGAMAIEEKTVYCGTGNAYRAGDSFPGVGLFRSDDNGNTWTHIAEAGRDFPDRISTVAAYGRDVWVGTVVVHEEEDGIEEEVRSGIFYSADQGKNWQRIPFKMSDAFARRAALSRGAADGIFKNHDYQCHSIVLSPSRNGRPIIFAAITAPLNWGGIWRSYDGDSWEQLTRGLPSPREFGRTSLAVFKEQPNIVYALAGAADGRCLGVFRSCDGGDHWVSYDAKHFQGCGNLNYVNCVAVSPTNPDLVVCGARDLHRSTDGGRTWTQVTQWFAAPDSLGYSHPDHHALLWPVKERLYSANDGGVDVSVDEGITWRNLSHGLAISMFYDIDVAASFPPESGSREVIPELIIGGGTQDNASVITDVRASGIGYVPAFPGLQLGLTREMADRARGHLEEGAVVVNFDDAGMTDPSSAFITPPGPAVPLFLSSKAQSLRGARRAELTRDLVEILYGDGGWTVFDPGDPFHVYASSQNMTIYRHRRDSGWQEVTPVDATDEERYRIWMAILAIHPKDPNIIFSGSTRVWRTNNDGDDWVAVSDELDGSSITAIEIADANPNFIYVGTENGNIFKSEDAGNRWTDEPGEYRPEPLEWRKDLDERMNIGVSRTVTRIEAHPNNAEQIAVTLMGFDRKYQLPHVLWLPGKDKDSDDKDRKWLDLSGDLPRVHHNVVTWAKGGEYLVVGNDIGVWAMDMTHGDIHHKWIDVSANLPNTIVTDLVYHARTESLVAATYGRSLWWTSMASIDKVVGRAAGHRR